MQVLEEEYASPAKDYNTSLTILPLTEDIVSKETLNAYLAKEGNKPSLLSRTNKNIYKNYFGLTFSETMTGDLVDLMNNPKLDFMSNIQFQEKVLPLNSSTNMSVMVPESGKLQNPDQPTNFTLLTQSMDAEIDYFEEQSKPVGGNAVQKIEFTLNLKYVLWDNNKEQIAGYGLIKERRNLTALPERIFYIQLFEDISRQIVKNSPIQERYV